MVATVFYGHILCQGHTVEHDENWFCQGDTIRGTSLHPGN